MASNLFILIDVDDISISIWTSSPFRTTGAYLGSHSAAEFPPSVNPNRPTSH